jgi:y4mF family transcriptional regulator
VLDRPRATRLDFFSPHRENLGYMVSPRPRSRGKQRPSSPDRESSALAVLVRDRRKAAGLTQRALSELAGVGPRAVWDLERGKATLRMDVVNRVLAVFGKMLGAVDAPRTEEQAP